MAKSYDAFYIGGEWVSPSSAATIQVVNPATEEPCATVPAGQPADIDRGVNRVASNVKKTPEELAAFLAANGSSIRSIRHQIQGEMAWRRLQSAKIENGVSIGDDEVKAVIEKMEASKGSQEYRIGEIFLSANSTNHAEVMGTGKLVSGQFVMLLQRIIARL